MDGESKWRKDERKAAAPGVDNPSWGVGARGDDAVSAQRRRSVADCDTDGEDRCPRTGSISVIAILILQVGRMRGGWCVWER